MKLTVVIAPAMSCYDDLSGLSRLDPASVLAANDRVAEQAAGRAGCTSSAMVAAAARRWLARRR